MSGRGTLVLVSFLPPFCLSVPRQFNFSPEISPRYISNDMAEARYNGQIRSDNYGNDLMVYFGHMVISDTCDTMHDETWTGIVRLLLPSSKLIKSIVYSRSDYSYPLSIVFIIIFL